MSFLKIFWRFFEKSDRTKYFFGNGLIEPKNWKRLLIGLLTSLIKRKNVIFPPKPSFLAKKKRLQQAASRGKWSFSWRNAIWAKKKRLRQAASQKRSKMPTFFAEKTAKNTKIVTKWSFMGRNGTATLPKWSEKQDLQESDRVIAPKPLKWGFKSDLMATNFSKIFQKIAEIK